MGGFQKYASSGQLVLMKTFLVCFNIPLVSSERRNISGVVLTISFLISFHVNFFFSSFNPCVVSYIIDHIE